MVVRSLSPTEARVVLALEEQGRDELSLDAIVELARVRRGFARKLAHDLAAKGWVQRVGRGRYLLNPSAYGPEAAPEGDPLRIGSHLVRPYYFGFATAAELWGWLHRPGRTYYLVTPTRSSVHVSSPATFRVVRVEPRRFFGVATVERRRQRLVVSDRERTVLDCLARPGLAGGMAGVAQLFARAKPQLSWDRLARHLRRLGNRSLGRRLGYLAEVVRPSVPAPAGWLRALRPGPAEPFAPLGPPHVHGRAGGREGRWRLVLNVPAPELLGEAEPR